MCCCRCPPSVGVTIYILLTIVVGFYFEHVKSVSSTSSLHTELIEEFSIKSRNLDELVTLKKRNEQENIIKNYTSEWFGSPDDVAKATKEIQISNTEIRTAKTNINNKSFCKIIDNYTYMRIGCPVQKVVSSCPVQAGFHSIYDNRTESNEMLGRKTVRPELIRHAAKIVFKQFQFINEAMRKKLWLETGL